MLKIYIFKPLDMPLDLPSNSLGQFYSYILQILVKNSSYAKKIYI